MGISPSLVVPTVAFLAVIMCPHWFQVLIGSHCSTVPAPACKVVDSNAH